MPAIHFVVRWPDGKEERCYSPSTILRDYLFPGAYALDDFLTRAHDGLEAASGRVREKFGYACSSALDQWGAIERTASQYRSHPAAQVTVLSVE